MSQSVNKYMKAVNLNKRAVLKMRNNFFDASTKIVYQPFIVCMI